MDNPTNTASGVTVAIIGGSHNGETVSVSADMELLLMRVPNDGLQKLVDVYEIVPTRTGRAVGMWRYRRPEV